MEWEKAIDLVAKSLKARGFSKETIKSYHYDFLRFARFKKESSPLEIEKGDVMEYIFFLQDKGIAKQTINRKLIALRTFYDHLIELEKATQNPLRNVKLLKTRRDQTHTSLTPPQSKALIESLSQHSHGVRDLTIAFLMTRMGLRIGEVVRLNLEDVDFEQRTLRVHGKGDKIRLLPLPSDMALLLIRYVEEVRPKWAKKGERALFVSRLGKRISRRTLHYWINRSIKETGLYAKEVEAKHRITPHKLRHTFAVQAILNGVDILTLKEILGHANVETTMIYAEADRKRIEKAMEEHPLRME